MLVELIKEGIFKIVDTKEAILMLKNVILEEIVKNERLRNIVPKIKDNMDKKLSKVILELIAIEIQPIISNKLRDFYKDKPDIIEQILKSYKGFNFLKDNKQQKEINQSLTEIIKLDKHNKKNKNEVKDGKNKR